MQCCGAETLTSTDLSEPLHCHPSSTIRCIVTWQTPSTPKCVTMGVNDCWGCTMGHLERSQTLKSACHTFHSIQSIAFAPQQPPGHCSKVEGSVSTYLRVVGVFVYKAAASRTIVWWHCTSRKSGSLLMVLLIRPTWRLVGG